MSNAREDAILQDLGILASAKIAAITLAEVMRLVGPELKKLSFSPLGLRSDVSRFDEDKAK